MRKDILEQKEQILTWINQGVTKAFMCKELKCKPETLNNYLHKMGIEYAGRPGVHSEEYDTRYKTAIEYINSGSAIKSHTLKYKLIRDGIKKKECELCGLSTWQEKEIPLELHHKDCNHYNNDIENLMILCPNCHSIQKGNSGANIGKNTINLFKEQSKSYYCCDCRKEISSRAIRCKACAAIERQRGLSRKPDRKTLKTLIRTTSFLEIGRQFGVSDNAVRKWCDSYNLPRKVAEIKSYSQEEWDKI